MTHISERGAESTILFCSEESARTPKVMSGTRIRFHEGIISYKETVLKFLLITYELYTVTFQFLNNVMFVFQLSNTEYLVFFYNFGKSQT